jgi:serine protease Do
MNNHYEEEHLNENSNNEAVPDEANDVEQNEKVQAEKNAGEYRYVRPDEPYRAYEDAGYIPEKEAPVTPRQYHCSSKTTDEKVKKPKRPRKSIFIAAACVVCVLIGTAIGLNINNDKDDGQEQEMQSAKDETNSTLSSAKTTNTDVSPASDIYSEACQQTVGISSEITTTNIFGQTVSGSTSGSGFVVSEDGYILTNYHVIEEAYKGGYDITVMFYNGDTYTATVVGTESDNDIAVLKIDADGLTPAELGDSDSMMVGETIYAVGNPLGELSYTMTDGIVSALDREIATDDSSIINMFQISAAVNSGNSGGPVYNGQGQVIGITTAKYGDVGVEGLGFAIPINDAIEIANELIQNGYVSGKPYMGLSAYDVSSSAVHYYNMVAGAYIASIEEGSCAEKAGMEVGDIITAIGETKVESVEDLKAAVKNYSAGDTAPITLYRSGKYETVDLVFDEKAPTTTPTSDGIEEQDAQAQSGNTVLPQQGQNVFPFAS